MAEADAWRMVNAPPRPGNAHRAGRGFAGEQSSAKNPAEGGEKNGGDTVTTTPANSIPAGGEWQPARVDVAAMVTKGGDFDELVLQHAEEVAQIAYGLFRLAAETASPNSISAATKNWHEAARATGDIRTRYIEALERRRVLLPLDEVMDIVGTELQAVRAAFTKLGERVAASANPAEPSLAQRAIEEEIDRVFSAMDQLAARARRELAAPAA